MNEEQEQWAGERFIEVGRWRRNFNKAMYVMSALSITCAGINWFIAPEERTEYVAAPIGASVAMLGAVALSNAVNGWLQGKYLEFGTASFDESFGNTED